MVTFITLLVITLIIGLCITFTEMVENYIGEFISMISMSSLLTCMITMGIMSGEPSAIDVYRGKTTLKITYKDNIPTDTIVVYK